MKKERDRGVAGVERDEGRADTVRVCSRRNSFSEQCVATVGRCFSLSLSLSLSLPLSLSLWHGLLVMVLALFRETRVLSPARLLNGYQWPPRDRRENRSLARSLRVGEGGESGMRSGKRGGEQGRVP